MAGGESFIWEGILHRDDTSNQRTEIEERRAMTQSDCDPGSSVLDDQSLNEEIDFCWIEGHRNS